MAKFSFDVFSGDVVPAICSGGKLVLCPAEFLLMPARLYALMHTEKVDLASRPVVFRRFGRLLEEAS